MAGGEDTEDRTVICTDGVVKMGRGGSQARRVDVGRVLGDFVLQEKVGEGGAGMVFHAHQVSLARDAVVKVLRKHAAETGARDRFLREARLASSLDHPYAAHVYAFGVEDDGTMWIAMEFVRGVSLQELLNQRGPLPLRRFVPLFDRICEVVHTAHQQGIVHRDLKPANVMIVSRAGRLLPKLLDFGIAKVLDVSLDGESAPVPLAVVDREPSIGREHQQERGGEQTRATDAEHRAPEPGVLSVSDASGERSSPGLSLVGITAHFEGHPRDDSIPRLGEVSRLGGTSRGGSVSRGEGGTGHGSSTFGGTLAGNSILGSITKIGTVMGSPSFMSPEQWREPSAIDERTDIYALGILAYNVLVGELPFVHGTARRLAHAHLHAEPPALGGSFPRALTEAIHRALRKRKEERFRTPLEFAAAVRKAAGFAEDEGEHSPRLDPGLSDAALLQAPAPIAEAVAAIDGARNLDHARQAFVGLIRTIARVIGTLAIASRAALAAAERTLEASSRQKLRLLRERDLDPVEWLELAEDLCRAWSGREALHPIPELVAFCCTAPQSEEPAKEHSKIALVRHLYAALSTPTDEVGAVLHGNIAGLNRLVRDIGFLQAYPWIVPTPRGHEMWMGLREQPLQASEVDEPHEHPFLCSFDGAPLVSLWPLVDVAEPTPGAKRKLFLLGGPGRQGARLLAEPAGYVRDSEYVWPFFASLLGEDERPGKDNGVDSDGTPFKGLTTFSADDRDVFFGRERETQAVINRLKNLALLAVVGPSGSGKSSFVFAGILPNYPGNPAIARVRPGRRPLDALATGLRQAGFDLSPAQILLAPEGAAQALLASIRQTSETHLVIVLDQFEELFTLGSDGATKAALAGFLAALSVNPADPVRIIITLRDDFLVRAEELAPLRGRIAYGLALLTTPQREDLLRILLEPAHRAGYRFEDERLPAEMVADVEGRPGALALLSFTAAKLWELRDRSFRRLLRRSYQDLGGVGGALAQHAERTLAGFEALGRALVREAFRHLVTAEGTRSVLARAELEQILAATGGGTAHDVVIERLLDSRLLVASEGDDRIGDRIEISHEALISAWPRLLQWRQEDVEGARLREQLRSAARQWHERRRPKGLLWRDEALAEYQLWKTRHPQALTDIEAAFAEASLAEARRTRRTRQALLASTMLGLSGFAAVVTWQRGLAIEHRDQAQEQRSAAQEARETAETVATAARAQLAHMQLESGRRELLADEPLRAFAYLVESRRNGAEGAALDFLTRRSLDALDHHIGVVGQHEEGVKAVGFAAGSILSYGQDGPIRVWDAAGRLKHELPDGPGIIGVGLHPSEPYIAVASGNRARIWNMETGASILDLETGQEVWQAVFSPGGDRIAVAGKGSSSSLWSFPEGRKLASLPEDGTVLQASFSKDGTLLATGGWGGVSLWSVETGARVHDLPVSASLGVSRVSFLPRERIIVGQIGGALEVWSTNTGRRLATLAAEPDPYRAVSISADGSRIVTGSSDGVTRVYDAEKYALELTMSRHDGSVQQVAFTPDGTGIVTAGQDGLVRVWDASTGERLATFGDHVGRVSGVGLDEANRTLVTGGADGRVSLWKLPDSERLARWPVHDQPIWQVTFSRDGDRVLTAAEDGRVRVWDVATQRLVEELAFDRTRYAHAAYWRHIFAAWHPDERSVAVADGAGVGIWDLATDQKLATVESPGSEVYFASWNAAGTHLAFGGQDGGIYIWDGKKTRRSSMAHAHTQVIWGVSFSPRGDRIVSFAEDGLAKLWDGSGALVSELRDHVGPLVHGRFDATGERVITTSHDKTARIWRVSSNDVLVLEGHRSALLDAAISPDGEIAASVSGDGELIIWDAATGALLRRYRADTKMSAIAVAFDPEGGRLATAGDDGMLRVWDVRRDPIPDLDVLTERLRCQVPHRLENNRLVQSVPDSSDCNSSSRPLAK